MSSGAGNSRRDTRHATSCAPGSPDGLHSSRPWRCGGRDERGLRAPPRLLLGLQGTTVLAARPVTQGAGGFSLPFSRTLGHTHLRKDAGVHPATHDPAQATKADAPPPPSPDTPADDATPAEAIPQVRAQTAATDRRDRSRRRRCPLLAMPRTHHTRQRVGCWP